MHSQIGARLDDSCPASAAQVGRNAHDCHTYNGSGQQQLPTEQQTQASHVRLERAYGLTKRKDCKATTLRPKKQHAQRQDCKVATPQQSIYLNRPLHTTKTSRQRTRHQGLGTALDSALLSS